MAAPRSHRIIDKAHTISLKQDPGYYRGLDRATFPHSNNIYIAQYRPNVYSRLRINFTKMRHTKHLNGYPGLNLQTAAHSLNPVAHKRPDANNQTAGVSSARPRAIEFKNNRRSKRPAASSTRPAGSVYPDRKIKNETPGTTGHSMVQQESIPTGSPVVCCLRPIKTRRPFGRRAVVDARGLPLRSFSARFVGITGIAVAIRGSNTVEVCCVL